MACTAEYFFEYKIERVFGDESKIATPKIYFERDYKTENLPYSMFAVPEEWLNKQETVNELQAAYIAEDRERILNRLIYDEINVVFDMKGISCATLADHDSVEYNEAEIKYPHQTFDAFYRNGCKITIEKNNAEDHSGVGVIEMLKGGEIVAKFFFAVNFTFRKNIYYKLKVVGKTAELEFRCKDRPKDVEVCLVYNNDRLPCLKNDMGINQIATFKLDFSSGEKFIKKILLNDNAANGKGVLSVAISNSSIAKYYILDCESNNTLQNQGSKKIEISPNCTCPFCHKPIDYDVSKNAAYKKGGTACNSKKDASKNAKMFTFENKHGAKLKRCLYCAQDLTTDPKNGNLILDPNRLRLLPLGYMEHDNYKIAFAGSTRAGKTTYISRFFGITGDGKISIPMTMTVNSLDKFGISIKSAPILEVEAAGGGIYNITDTNWTDKQEQYKSRSINLNPPCYPQMTQGDFDYTSYPFIAEVNGDAYVSFYDIAGEDSQSSMQIQNIANNEPIGIFCIINGKKDISGNSRVINMLNAANINENSPIAVIVTKMDMFEGVFDSSCQCLRSDYFDSGNIYEGSNLERVINISSEEIRAYLMDNDLLPNFGGKYKNIRYFVISSFNFMDSIHNKSESENTPGKVKFECSSKRMELPFLWMVKQFGIIK